MVETWCGDSNVETSSQACPYGERPDYVQT